MLAISPGVASEYDKVLVDKDFPVLPDTTVASNKEFLYVLTSSKVSSINYFKAFKP